MGVVAVAGLCLGLASCAAGESDSAEDLTAATALAGRLDAQLRAEGRTPYGGLSGGGGAAREGTVQIAGDRGTTSIYAVCHGPAGEAGVSVDDGAATTLSCSDEPQAIVVQDDWVSLGVRLKVRVDGAPAGSVWAVTAGASSWVIG
ncbi:MAG: hypothetical protein PIR02_18955 [Microbacterium enclense]